MTSFIDCDFVMFFDMTGKGLEARSQIIVDNVFVVWKFLALFNLLFGVTESLLDHFWCLSPSFLESFFNSFKAGGINEYVVTVNVVIMNFLTALNVDVHDAYLASILYISELALMSSIVVSVYFAVLSKNFFLNFLNLITYLPSKTLLWSRNSTIFHVLRLVWVFWWCSWY